MIALGLHDWPYLMWLAVAVAAAALSFGYSGLETGIYMMNKIRLDLRAETGSRAARTIRKIVSDQSRFLAILLIGNSLATYAASFAISAMFVLAGYGEHSEWLALAVATPLLFVLCESVPKNVAYRQSERLVYRLSGLLSVSDLVFRWTALLGLVRGVSSLLMKLTGARQKGYIPMGHEGLSAVVAEGHASGVLTHMQTIMADRVMHIGKVKVRDVMIPLGLVVTAPVKVDRPKMLELVAAHNFSRFPLQGEGGQIVGILNVYDALAEDQQVADRQAGPAVLETKAPPPLVVSDSASVTDALYRMQRTHSPMAVVADKAGRHVGIVTIKDLVEEIVGELDAW